MSKMAPNDGSLQTTKQMLDELDALMDRMLSLPVNELEDAPSALETPSVLAAKLTILDFPPAPAPVEKPQKASATQPAPPVAEAPLGNPALNPPHFALPVAPAEAPMAAAATLYVTPALPDPEPFTNEVEPPSVMPTLAPMLAALPQQPAAAVALGWCYMPLLWINQMFDRLAQMLPAGRWLRSQGGRMLLGVAGIMMTAAAVGWLLNDWLGWNR